jgi:hypothetical protein
VVLLVPILALAAGASDPGRVVAPGVSLKVVNEEVDRLNRIVVDFLFAVRPMDARLVKQDLNQIVRDLIEFMRFELEEARVRDWERIGRGEATPEQIQRDENVKRAYLGKQNDP